MGVEYDVLRGVSLFLAGLVVAAVGLRIILRWRYANALARARRIADRLREPPSSLSAVEDRSAATEELIDFSDARAAAAVARELLSEEDRAARAAAIEVLRQTRALDRWCRDLRRGSFQQKLRAIKALGEVGDERAIDELLEALADDDPGLAGPAALAMFARDADYACTRLADALSSPTRRLAETAAAALVHMGEDAVDYLVGQLASLSPQARRLAAESLGSIGEEHLKEALLPLLNSDPDPGVRAAVASALARVDGDTATVELRRLARFDPDWFVRARAYSLLAETDAEGAVQYLLDGLASFEPEFDGFSEDGHSVESFTEGSRRVRRAIIAGLRMLGFTEDEVAAAEHGAVATSLTSDELVEASAALALLRSPDPMQRAEGARRLSELGPPAAEPLAAALCDPDVMVRAEVARSLAHIGSVDSLGALARCLQDPDPNVRLAATTALRAVVTREATRELTE
jgi:HEAT repeat protein